MKLESSTPESETPDPSTKHQRRRQKFSHSCIRIMPARRKLQPLQAYTRLVYKDDVREAYQAARNKYVEECQKSNEKPLPDVAYRNQWLKERLEKESEDVKQEVEEYCQSEGKDNGSDEDVSARNARYARCV
jgi:hypothetical protein